MIDVIMPVKEGRFIPQEVLDALLAQGIPFRLFVSTRISDGDYPAARNNVKQYGRSPMVLMRERCIAF